MNLYRFAPLLLIAGCATGPTPTFVVREVPVAVSSTNRLDVIRFPASYRAYHVGRRIDSGNPTVLHESHVLYVREQPERWNLQPSATVPDLPGAPQAPAVVPLPIEGQLRLELRKQESATQAIEAQSQKLKAVTDAIEPLMQSTSALTSGLDARQKRIEERLRLLEVERGANSVGTPLILTNR